jgi:ATP adenylyltransferase
VDVLWSPWRYDYIKSSGGAVKDGCVFCNMLANSATDDENFILKRAEFNFVVLNIYPYISGHVMIVPYEHISLLSDAGKQTTDEMMELTKQAQAAISDVYRPDGVNLGMNLGRAAGAGVDSHFHMHVLPRWVGDANFLTAIGQTRSIPESLETTYEKLKGKI